MKQGYAVVWLSYPQQVHGIDFTDAGTFLTSSGIAISDPALDMAPHGWHRLGMATIRLDFNPSPETLAAPAVQTLRASLAKFDAECEEKRQYFLQQIGKLEALPGVGA
jgi:hypothetical protein